jgi:CheY-like chemotaxis protein
VRVFLRPGDLPPLTTRNGSAPPGENSLAHCSACTAAATGVRRALIIDDNRSSAAIAAAMLKANGWEFDLAHDGFEGVNHLRTRSYDKVLLDYRLPGMDGVEVMRWIRRNLDHPPGVVVLSSDDSLLLYHQFDGLGVKAILSKPVSATDLCQAMAT